MPRGIRSVINYDTKIEEIDIKIAKLHKEIKKLERQRDKYIAEKKAADLDAVLDAMTKKGISIDDLVNQAKSKE